LPVPFYWIPLLQLKAFLDYNYWTTFNKLFYSRESLRFVCRNLYLFWVSSNNLENLGGAGGFSNRPQRFFDQIATLPTAGILSKRGIACSIWGHQIRVEIESAANE